MPKSEESDEAYELFQRKWEEEKRTGRVHEKYSLVRALLKAFWVDLAIAAVYKAVWGALIILCAYYFVRELVDFAKVDNLSMKRGWLLAAFFGVTCFLLSLCLQQMTSYSTRVGLRVRSAMITAIYRKALVTEAVASKAGDILTLVATDCSRLEEGCTNVHYLWSGPVECITIIGLVFKETGISALIALIIIICVIPIQYGIGLYITKVRRANILTTDTRVQIMHEIISAIKLVKFYSWEESFANTVKKLRAQETVLIRRSSIMKSIHLCLVFIIPPLLVLSVLSVYLHWEVL